MPRGDYRWKRLKIPMLYQNVIKQAGINTFELILILRPARERKVRKVMGSQAAVPLLESLSFLPTEGLRNFGPCHSLPVAPCSLPVLPTAAAMLAPFVQVALEEKR